MWPTRLDYEMFEALFATALVFFVSVCAHAFHRPITVLRDVKPGELQQTTRKRPRLVVGNDSCGIAMAYAEAILLARTVSE